MGDSGWRHVGLGGVSCSAYQGGFMGFCRAIMGFVGLRGFTPTGEVLAMVRFWGLPG